MRPVLGVGAKVLIDTLDSETESDDVGDEVESVPDRSRLELVKGLPPEVAVELAPLMPVKLRVEKMGVGNARDREDVRDEDKSVPVRSLFELVKGLPPETAVELAPLVPATLRVEKIGMTRGPEKEGISVDEATPDKAVELALRVSDTTPEEAKPELKAVAPTPLVDDMGVNGAPVVEDRVAPDAAVELALTAPPPPPEAAKPKLKAVPPTTTVDEMADRGARVAETTPEPAPEAAPLTPETTPEAAKPELKAVPPATMETEGAGVCKTPEPAPPFEPPPWPPLEKMVKVEKTEVEVTPAPVIIPAPLDPMPPTPLPPLPPPEPPVAME